MKRAVVINTRLLWRDLEAKRAAAFVLSLLVVFGLAAPCAPAFAEVRKADVVLGKTVEERELSVSQSPSISAERAALVGSDGTVYFARSGDEAAQIASITKVMCAIVALDRAKDDLEIPVSAAAAEIGESSAGLQEGDVMDLTSALKALLVPSGNDAAVAIAEAVGAELPGGKEDPVSAFVAAMNEKADELGLSDTVYENPHGLDDGEYEGNLHSTALDQAKVAQCAMSYKEIAEIVGGGSTSIKVKRGSSKETIELETTDLLLDMYSHAKGIKTGITNLAGPSFMGAAEQDGREMYAIVLNSNDEYSRFEDAKSMFMWGYEHIVEVPLANSDERGTLPVGDLSREVPVVAELSHYDWLDRTVKACLAESDASVQVFDLEGNVSQDFKLDELHGTINVGDKVGSVSYYQNNRILRNVDLIACEHVEAPNALEMIAIWWQRMSQGLDDKSGRAPSRILNLMPIINDNTSAAA